MGHGSAERLRQGACRPLPKRSCAAPDRYGNCPHYYSTVVACLLTPTTITSSGCKKCLRDNQPAYARRLSAVNWPCSTLAHTYTTPLDINSPSASSKYSRSNAHFYLHRAHKTPSNNSTAVPSYRDLHASYSTLSPAASYITHTRPRERSPDKLLRPT
jgi:hypothetical protein